jgi:hypothetical protein
VRQGCRTLLEGQESLPANPDKTDGAQEASGISGGFLLDTFLCPHKEKYLARGCENPHLNNSRVSDTINLLNLFIDFP